MSLKKFILIGSALAAWVLPAIANADLITRNNSPDYSTVRITSSKDHYCSFGGGPLGAFNKATAPNGGVSYTSAAEARTICQEKGRYCEADMYPSKNCSGSPIAHLKIDLVTLQVTQIGPMMNSHYSLNVAGSTVTINYN